MRDQRNGIASRIPQELDAVTSQALLRETCIPDRLEFANRLGRHGERENAVRAQPHVHDLRWRLVVAGERFEQRAVSGRAGLSAPLSGGREGRTHGAESRQRDD
jgi:hypothetical protein